MDENQRRLDAIRRGSSELENSFIDEFAAGRLSRREFVRRGAVAGLSMPLLAAIMAACGGANSTGSSSSGGSSGAGKPGGTIKAGIVTPTAAINPVTVADQGGLDMLGQTGEYLAISDSSLNLVPVLAESWSANANATVWTFKIRQGVKFHNGQALTADDVVYTYKLQADPKGSSNALSAFGGVLVPSGVQKVDDFTVAFHLEAPNGNFPYLCSSDNYNMIILPNNYDPTKWESSFLGTGPFKLQKYTPKVGASFVRNDAYWGKKALPDSTEFTFYDTQQPEILALQGGHARRDRPVLGPGRPVAALGLERERDQPEVERSPPALDALRPGAVHRPPGTPGDRAHPEPARHHPGPLPGQGRPGQRQPVRARVPVHRHERHRSACRT